MAGAPRARRRPADPARDGPGRGLDFVPNHVAPDHPWTVEHPDFFVAGTDDDSAGGRGPVFGETELLQSDPAWQGLLWFPEYFHGDTGAGLGAMHQTGWTAEIINLLLNPPRDTTPA